MTLSADRPVVTLLDGRSVSSWGPAECLARHQQVVRIMRLDDREDRRYFIANIERSAAESAPPGVDPAVYAAEVRRRLEAAVLDHWQRARAAQAA